MTGYIKRDRYLRQLISRKDNGEVKIITGSRRCGKACTVTGWPGRESLRITSCPFRLMRRPLRPAPALLIQQG